MEKPAYNFGKTASLKAQQRKQMDSDLKRRIARQNKANMKSDTPDKESSDSRIELGGRHRRRHGIIDRSSNNGTIILMSSLKLRRHHEPEKWRTEKGTCT